MSANINMLKKFLGIVKKILKKSKVSPIDEVDYIDYYAGSALLAGGKIKMTPHFNEDEGEVTNLVESIETTGPVDVEVAKAFIECTKHAITEQKDAQILHTKGEVAVAIMTALSSGAVTALIFYWLITLGDKALSLFM